MAPSVVSLAAPSSTVALEFVDAKASNMLPRGPLEGGVNTFSEPAATDLPLRGKQYMADKVKYPAGNAAFRLLNVDVFQNSRKGRFDCYAQHPDSYLSKLLASGNDVPFVIMLHFQSLKYNMVVTWAVDQEVAQADTEFGRLWRQFVEGSDEFRNDRFKIIPQIVEGSWMLRKACGQARPILFATKLTHTFEATSRYLIIKCDTASSKLAANLTDLSIGCASSLTIDMACLVEGRTEAELPERVFGTFRLSRPDLRNCRVLDVDLPPQ